MAGLIEKIKEAVAGDEYGIKTEEMTEAGLHYGHRTSRTHPKMKQYISGIKNNIHTIDLEKTKEKLEIALKFIADLTKEKKTLVLIGTKVQAKEQLKQTAIECGLPYVSERWLGGTFTNFKTIRKRVDYYIDLENKKEAGELQKYTKKERSLFDKEIKKLEVKFGGIKNMDKLPDAIFVADIRKDELAVKEARRKKIKVIAVVDTNVDPSEIDYPIPANDETVSSVRYILEKIKEIILKNK